MNKTISIEDVKSIAKGTASVGFRQGYSEATDCIRGLIKGANNPEASKYAEMMVKLLEQFAEQAHNAFMEEGLYLEIIENPDRYITFQ
jgi:hypothetical protein